MKAIIRRLIRNRNKRMGKLPFELLEQIILQFMRNPLTTFDQLKELRLVCKTFNAIIAPKVLLHIRPFDGRHVWRNIRYLHTLLSIRRNSDLRVAEKLILRDWIWIYGPPYFISYRRLSKFREFVSANSSSILYYLLRFLFRPQVLPNGIRDGTLRVYARLRLPITPRFNLPNIRCVMWRVNACDPKWTTTCTVKALLHFPRLDELVLSIDVGVLSVDYLVDSLCKLRNLRKLGVHFEYNHFGGEPNAMRKFGKLIAANPHLTRLELARRDPYPDFTLYDLLKFLPADPPLKLEHFGLGSGFEPSAALIPHIRSLTSCYFTESRLLEILFAEGVFPPTMYTESDDEITINYLNNHPGIVSLTFMRGFKKIRSRAVFNILAQHSETLIYFQTTMRDFFEFLTDSWNESLLLQCTNLKELVLDESYSSRVVDA
ncbi:hypothetical protein APHAL10511_003018, partial [Amanita phalloides]